MGSEEHPGGVQVFIYSSSSGKGVFGPSVHGAGWSKKRTRPDFRPRASVAGTPCVGEPHWPPSGGGWDARRDNALSAGAFH